MRARKKPIEVYAIRYTHNIILEKFLEVLRRNENEPVRYDESDGTIYIQKDRGEIALRKGNWVIFEENTDQSFWVIDNNIFVETYKRVKGTVSRFIKKIYDVDCVEFKDLSPESVINVLNFCDKIVSSADIDSLLAQDDLVNDIIDKGYIIVNTLEGDEKLFPSEILIKGVKGEYYPVKREQFDKVYEIIGD